MQNNYVDKKKNDVLETHNSNFRNGYILDSYSNDSKNESGPVNILTLCCLDNDGYFEVEIPNNRLVFFIARTSEIPKLRGMTRRIVGLTDFEGNKLDGLYFNCRSAYYEGVKRLKESRIRCLESDVQPDERFLMEHFIFRGISLPNNENNKGKYPFNVYRPEKITPAEYNPSFKISSLDIETGQDGTLYCCGFHTSCRGEESRVVLMLDNAMSTTKQEMSLSTGEKFTYIPVPNEKELLSRSLKYISRSDPDIIIGWNVIGFDLNFIENRCRHYGLDFSIGRRNQPGRIIRKRSGLFSVEAFGRLIIDGPVNLRGGFHSFDDYRLETVAKELLGEGKDISGHAESDEKISEIEDRFKNDKPALALYNIIDCILVSKIFTKTGLIEQLTTRSRLTGLRMDKVNQSVAAFDFFMLPRIHRAGYAAPDIADIKLSRHAAGGLVFTSDPGLYENIMVLDFLSLYPSIIRTFFIDPLSRITADRFPEGEVVNTPMNIKFSSDLHILPEHVSQLMESRARAKEAGDIPLSQAVKILMNSYYGVMGTPGCRFYHADLPTAITGTGQWILRTTSDYIKEKGFRVIYGDTDSVFVEIKSPEGETPLSVGKNLAEDINNFFRDKLRDEFKVDSQLTLEVEKLYPSFFLPPMRGSTEGSRKRYAGLINKSGEIEIKGLEYVRSDWTELAKDFQMELFRRFFLHEEIPLWISSQVEAIRRGERDDKLVYRKRLTKPADEYIKNIPPHVRAAIILDPEGKRGIRRISYIMTFRGPIPVAHDHRDIDYSHYIEKQIIPLADMVLPFIGTNFDEVMEGKQGKLF